MEKKVRDFLDVLERFADKRERYMKADPGNEFYMGEYHTVANILMGYKLHFAEEIGKDE